jgi:WD40 repeat protein
VATSMHIMKERALNHFKWSFCQSLVSVSVLMCILEPIDHPVLAGESEPAEKALPPGAIGRLGSLRLRHDDDARAIAFAPDGKKIASEHNQTIRVWETATGKLLHEFNARGIFSRDIFAREDYTLAFTPDGKSIAAGVRADVCFWDCQTGREIQRFRGKGNGITALTFSINKKSFYCGGSDNKLYQWDIATGKLLRTWDYFEGNQPRVFASGRMEKTADLKAVSSDGKTAVWLVTKWTDTGTGVGAGKGDTHLVLWDVATGKDRGRITDGNREDFFSAQVSLSRDGKRLTAFNLNSPMIMWDAVSAKNLGTLSSGSVEAVAYSTDCLRSAAFIRGQGLTVWDLVTRKELWRDEIAPWYADGRDKAMAFSPDGKTIALAFGKNVLIWDAASGKGIPALHGHRWPVRKIAFFPKNGTLISADYSTVCEWNSEFRETKRQPLIEYHGHSRSAAESWETKLRIFQPEGKPPQLRELATDKPLHEFADLKGVYYHGCFSADGSTAALTRRDEQEIVFLDIATRKVRAIFTSKEPLTENLILNRDGKMLAVCCINQTILLIDSFQGKIIRQFGTPRSAPGKDDPRIDLTHGAFSPDGRLLAFGTQMERPGDHWKWKFGAFDKIDPDPPGIRVWYVETGRELGQFEKCLASAAHGRITSLRFSPDNKNLAAALSFNPWRHGDLEQSTVPVVEVASGRLRRGFNGHTDHVLSIAFSHDGKILASGSKDSTILLWDMMRPMSDVRAPKKGTEELLSAHWNKLADPDAAAAYDAVLALAKMPECIPFLANRVKPIETPTPDQLAKWIADLNADTFTVRAQAAEKLTAVHDLAAPALKKAMMGKGSLELRRRIEAIASLLEPTSHSPTLMRDLRSVEVLEQIGSKEACQVLESLAKGASEARLTIEAKDSVSRLKKGRH